MIGQIAVFQTDYGVIKLLKKQLWRHRYYFCKTSPNKCHRIFFHFGSYDYILM